METLIFGEVASEDQIFRPTKRRGGRSLTVAVKGGAAVEMTFPIALLSRSGSASRKADLRTQKLNPALAYRVDESDTYSRGLWTDQAAHELISRLTSEGAPQAEVILFAARNGGTITREQVRQVTGFPPKRMLRGFTRPPSRIARRLIDEGLLPPEAELPLQTKYASGVSATHFEVPREFSDILR